MTSSHSARDIDQLSAALQRAHPKITIVQRADAAVPEADDIWHVQHPDGFAEVHVRTGTGNAPFMVSSDFSPPTVAKTTDAAVKMVVARLGLGIGG